MTIDRLILEEYRALIRGNPDAFIAEVVTTYLDNSSQALEKLRDAVARGDSETAARLAHIVRGGSLSVGANRMAELMGSLEETARGGSLDGAAQTMTAAEQEFEAVGAALREMAGLPPAA